MVLVAGKEQLAVQPHLPAVLAADADLRRAVLGAEEIGGRIAHHAFLHAKGLVEVDLAVLVRAGEVHPPGLLGLALVGGVKLQLLLRRILRGKATPVRIAERRDHLPAHEEAEVPGQVHLLAQLAQLLGQCLDLVLITRRRQPFAKGHDGGVLVLLFQRRIAGIDQLGHRMAAQVGAGVLQQRRGQILCQLFIGAMDQVKGHHACAGAVVRVLEKRHQRLHRQLLGLQRLVRQHAHGGPQPVFRQRVGPVHALQHLRQHGGVRLHDLLPRLPRRLIALPLPLHRAQRLDGFRQILRRQQRRSGQGKQTDEFQFHTVEQQAFTKNAPSQA